MVKSDLLFLGVLVLLAEGIFFWTLNNMPDEANRQKLFAAWKQWATVTPTKKTIHKHKVLALGLIFTAVFALGPLGYTMLDAHPCGAWAWWAVASACTAYSFWSVTPMRRWVRAGTIAIGSLIFLYSARASIYPRTELDFFFVHPGVYSPAVLTAGGAPGWIFMVNGQHTRRPIFSADLSMEDMEMIRRARSIEKSNPNEAAQLIQKSWYTKHYAEIDPASDPDKIIFIPLNVNTQEYVFNATYRMGDKSYQSTEELRIVNVGEQITFTNRMTAQSDFQESFTMKNQVGKVLAHCVDPKFPRDERWIAGPPCYPGATFNPLPRSWCERCFARGFEWLSQ